MKTYCLINWSVAWGIKLVSKPNSTCTYYMTNMYFTSPSFLNLIENSYNDSHIDFTGTLFML